MNRSKVSVLILGILLVGGGFFLFRRRQSVKAPAPSVTPSPTSARGESETPSETPYETFTTADGRFSFEYPTTWTRTEIQNLETVLPKEFIDKYELTMPLILSDPRGAQTTLSTYRFEKGLDLDAGMDALAAELVEMGQPYNEVDRQTVGDSLVVDSTVETQGVTVQVRDLLFLILRNEKNTIYNLSFSARQSAWGDYETIFNHIQNSARLSP